MSLVPFVSYESKHLAGHMQLGEQNITSPVVPGELVGLLVWQKASKERIEEANQAGLAGVAFERGTVMGSGSGMPPFWVLATKCKFLRKAQMFHLVTTREAIGEIMEWKEADEEQVVREILSVLEQHAASSNLRSEFWSCLLRPK